MDVFGGDAIGGEGWVGRCGGFLRPRRDAEGRLRAAMAQALQSMLEQELEKHAIKLHADARH